MKLITNWRTAYRLYSVRVYGVLVLLPLIWAELPQEVKDLLPPPWQARAITAMALIGLYLRLVDQTRRREDPEERDEYPKS